jgi:hypothetical protein
MSALGGKADMTLCGNPLSRSLSAVKRTCRFALQMSATDPKRTCYSSTKHPRFGYLGRVSKRDMRNAVTYEGAEFAHAHFPMRSQRWCIICSHECHGRAVTHMRLQHVEQRGGEPISPLGFRHANRAIEVAIGRRRESTQHGLDDRQTTFRMIPSIYWRPRNSKGFAPC